jgi:glycosyltransferase involved in cell wall biosynthesis
MKHRYLIVGNNTFLGFSVGETLTSQGREVHHVYFPRQAKRCFPEEYFSDGAPAWSKQKKSLADLTKTLVELAGSRKDDFKILCTGEIESCILTQLGLNHYWMADGADLSEQPFQLSAQSLNVRSTIQSSQHLRKILTSQRDHKFACRLLGISERLDRRFFCPVRPALVDIAKLKLLSASNSATNDLEAVFSKSVILSATRRVYSGSPTFSKGTEHVVGAAKLLRDADIEFICTLSGPDAERFRNDVAEAKLPKLRLLNHLKSTELMQLMTKIGTIVLDQFGESETAYSGILRESMISGLPVVSDHFFDDIPSFARPKGLMSAHTASEINSQVRHLLSLSAQSRHELHKQILEQAIDLFDSESWVYRLEDMIH